MLRSTHVFLAHTFRIWCSTFSMAFLTRVLTVFLQASATNPPFCSSSRASTEDAPSSMAKGCRTCKNRQMREIEALSAHACTIHITHASIRPYQATTSSPPPEMREEGRGKANKS